MPTLTIWWVTKHDNHVCPICLDLETSGYKWIIPIGQVPFPQNLSHPIHGVVWDKVIGSIVHGFHGRLGCRCTIAYEFDVSDLNAKLQSLVQTLTTMVKTKENK